jgi:competence protein ComEC
VLVACDVGQGDGLVLRAGDRAGVVVDTGPEPEPMSRCLRRLALRTVPAVVLSHFHADHVEGVPAVLSRYRVEALLVGSLREPATEAGRVAAWATAARVPVRVLLAGQHITIGTAALDVIAPVVLEPGTDSYPNNDSLVLRAIDDGLTLLLTGDVEQEAQSAILATGVPLTADVLKVPHHGSANQDPQFLAAVHARLGVISVGADNTYGQPSPVTLSRLTHDGVATYRTDLSGDIAVVARNGRLSVVTDRSNTARSAPRLAIRLPEHRPWRGSAPAAGRARVPAADRAPLATVDRSLSPPPLKQRASGPRRALPLTAAARGPPALRPVADRGPRSRSDVQPRVGSLSTGPLRRALAVPTPWQAWPHG